MRLLVTIRLLSGRWCRSVRSLSATEPYIAATISALRQPDVRAALAFAENERCVFSDALPDAAQWLREGGEESVRESVMEFLQAYCAMEGEA